MNIKLELPEERHRERAEQLKAEFFSEGENEINGSALFDRMGYSEWLEHTTRNRDVRTVRDDWVEATTFFAVRETDDRIVGMVDLRHNIDNVFLAEYGGHIGYAVRPSERRRGYGASELKMAVSYARCLGIKSVMLGCFSDNAASAKTIESVGGVLAEVKPYLDGRQMNIYWIEL